MSKGGIWQRFQQSRLEFTRSLNIQYSDGSVGVRVTHMPTGITRAESSGRSRGRNKVLAAIEIERSLRNLMGLRQ